MQARASLSDITFELSGRRRQDARPGLAKMNRVLPDLAWWPAVGTPLERVVGPTLDMLDSLSYSEASLPFT
jgi:hypothetical protein